MNNQGGACDFSELRNEIVIAEALPDGLLNSRHDAKRSEVFGVFGVSEISGNAQLEGSLSPGVGVGIAEAGLGQLLPHSLNGRPFLSLCELRLELVPVLSG